jgi:hypothetical protein
VKLRKPRVVGGANGAAIWEELRKETAEVIDALHLFKSGHFNAPALLVEMGWPFKSGHSSQPLSPVSSVVNWGTASYSINNDECALLEQLCKLLRSRKKELLSQAIRRFGFAAERHRIDDKIADLMIAAESLFLGGNGKLEGEITYRLAVRAAFFVKAPQFLRRDVFDLVKRAYGSRFRRSLVCRPRSERRQ